MVVVVDARCIFDSGIGIYVSEVLSRIKNVSGFKFKVILMRGQQDKFLKLNVNIDSADICLVDYGRYSVKNFYALNKFLYGCDLYWMPTLSFPPISKVKKIVTVHDLCPVALWKIFGLLKALSYWLILGSQLVLSKRIICISNFTKSELLRFYSSVFEGKIKVIYNGISNRFSLSQAKRISRKDKPYLLCVGNVKPHKNLLNLVSFFENSSSFSKSYDLVVVGRSDGFRTGFSHTLGSSDGVIFTGFVEDDELASLYRNASAFIFPSFYEGFGLPLLEAMVFDLPILAADIDVFKEIAGDTINYFNHSDFSDFDLQLTELLNSDLSDYGVLINSFTWDRCVNSIVEIMNDENSSS